MRVAGTVAVAMLLTLVGTSPALSQVHITPTIGAFHPDRSPLRLKDEDRQDDRIIRGRTLALGTNIEIGPLRGTVTYATKAEILAEGAQINGPIGEGRLLSVMGGFAIRPIPRFAGIQPYGIVGAGAKRFDYSWDVDRVGNALPSDETDFAWQAGAGVDLMLGPLGIVAEVNDMITPEDEVRHDTFIMFGLRLALGYNNDRGGDNNNNR